MSYSKRQLVEEAYAELALAGYVFDLQPEEMQWGLRRLEMMMAMWALRGRHIGFASAGPDESDLDQDSGLALGYVEAVSINLAISLSAGKGKSLSAATIGRADDALQALMQTLALSNLKQQRTPAWMPRGAGAKADRRLMTGTFFAQPEAGPVQESDNGETNLGG